MRVLLVSLNTVADPFPVFPLGLAYVRDAVIAAGHQVMVHDCLIDGTGAAFEQRIATFAPQVIGFSLRNIDNVRADDATSYIADLRTLVDRARASSSAAIVIGGAGYSIFPTELFEATGCDFGIRGDGEAPLVSLLAALHSPPAALERVPNLTYRIDGVLRQTPPDAAPSAPPIAFDPDPTWVAAYRQRNAIFNVQSQRGCPLSCTYCTYPLIEGHARRLREIGRVVTELRRWRELGVRYVFVVDSVLNTSAAHLRALGRALLEARVDIEWGCFLRPTALNRDDLHMLADAGLRHIEFGSDSFADLMLRSYGKSFSFGMIERASEWVHSIGIHHSHFLILGGPGETESTLAQTFTRSEHLPGGVFFAFPGVRVYPRTPLWFELQRRGIIIPDNLVRPHFFIEDGLTAADLTARVVARRQQDRRWAPPAMPPGFDVIAKQMRTRGIEGPLWEYVPLLP